MVEKALRKDLEIVFKVRKEELEKAKASEDPTKAVMENLF